MDTERFIASAPPGNYPIPNCVRSAAGTDRITAVWLNAAGGATYRLDPDHPGGTVRYAKFWAPGREHRPAGIGAPGPDLAVEAQRLRWASPFLTVPQVLDYYELPEGQLLLTAALDGQSLIGPIGRGDPARAAQALGMGLRKLHEALPVDSCPYRWDAATRIRWAPEHQRAQFLPIPEEDQVVCQGDPCAPNTLINESFEVTGHVDLGSLGVGDRWADLAVAAMSIGWNFGAQFESGVYTGYGIAEDRVKISYYRRLWDAT